MNKADHDTLEKRIYSKSKKKEFPNKKKEFPNKKKEFPNKKKEFSNKKKRKEKENNFLLSQF